MIVFECTDKRGKKVFHRVPNELAEDPTEAMRRLGVLAPAPWKVVRYPEGQPSKRRVLQPFPR